MSIEVRNRLEAVFGLKLATTLLFTYPHTAALAEHLLSSLHLQPEIEAESARTDAAPSSAVRDVAQEGIAIIGMAFRFPGGARTPEAFFQLIEEGLDAVTEPPYSAQPFKLARANSNNHGRAGQNVLYADGHVEFQNSPFCGMLRASTFGGTNTMRDNIYTLDLLGKSDRTQNIELNAGLSFLF